MNLPNQSFSCPVNQGKYPANCDQLQSLLIDMWLSGEISENDPEHVFNRNLQKCKDKLIELGRDDDYTEFIRNAYYETYTQKTNKDDLTDEEEQKILDDLQKSKSKK